MLPWCVTGARGQVGKAQVGIGSLRMSSHRSLPEEPGGLEPMTNTEVSLAPGAQRVLAEPQLAACSPLPCVPELPEAGWPHPTVALCWGFREADLPLRGERRSEMHVAPR